MNYLIYDTTANSNNPYIGLNYENCSLEENAIIFQTEKEAQELIDRNGWGWASVIKTDYPIN